MTKKERKFFEALSRDRAENAKVLEKPSMQGIKGSVVEKYSDQAHFIYELLQNADDAGATFAHFDLCNNELRFIHNGTRHFSISNPDTEENDMLNGTLGDINAITSIANSNKTDSVIGKFGVGFKAVFQYTQSPSIYDPNYRFKIERFMVPVEIEVDYPGRKSKDTFFIFPFNHPERNCDEAYNDISEKLCSLIYPVLFLTNLKKVSFVTSRVSGSYMKSIEEEYKFDDTIAQLVTLKKTVEDAKKQVFKDKLWLFTRKNNKSLTYAVGFSINKNGILVNTNNTAFCFFPTKESTELNFIIHAPFLLTDNREGIKAGEQHNKEMVVLLAELAADSLVYLRNLGKQKNTALISYSILDIIPYDENKFNDINDRSRISFKPFYESIKTKFSFEELLPSKEGFASSMNAYWSYHTPTIELFSNTQLAFLTGNENAKWVFASRSLQGIESSNRTLYIYVKSLIKEMITEKEIISRINKDFIEMQSIQWLHEFYQYISDIPRHKDLIKDKPIFLNQDRKPAAAFKTDGQAVLFLPSDNISGYDTVNVALLDNKDTVKFIRSLGIKEPSLRDEIYNIILPQYQAGISINSDQNFLILFKYYKECPQSDAEDYVNQIREYAFVCYRTADNDKIYYSKASDLYWPSENLKEYFKPKPDTRFVEPNLYKNLVNGKDYASLENFLAKLGVKNEPSVIEYNLTEEQAYKIKSQFEWPQPTYYNLYTREWTERYIDGCKQIINSITPEASIALWNQLIKIISTKCTSWKHFSKIINGTYKYFYRSDQMDEFESHEAKRLRTKPWLLHINNEFVSAEKLSLETLSPRYDTSSDEARELLQFLSIKAEVEKSEDCNNLTDEQRVKIEFANAYSDIPAEVLVKAAEEYRAGKQAGSLTVVDDEIDTEFIDITTSLTPVVSRVAREIVKHIITAPKEVIVNGSSKEDDSVASDEDDYIKPSIDFSKKIKQAKQQNAVEIAEIAHLDELTQRTLKSEKYTYGWFKALLELELLNSGENNANSREITISFSKVEREADTARTLILKHPNRYIPQTMEDLADIPLELHFTNLPTLRLAIEVVNVKSYTLRVKLKTNTQIDEVDLSLVTEAKIQAKNPVFLLDELRKQFDILDFTDGYNLQLNLCKNIEFIFGPPGTGKTSHLAREVILPIMRKKDAARVLVLTPTNKAADILILRLMEIMGTDHSYTDWLIRFGTTNSSIIEHNGVFRDKTFDIRSLSKSVTVTTIARFPYDFFMPDETTRLHLNALKWDYIVLDEASMIPLVNIIYPLFKKTPEKFFIAGDPFQIEPITTVDIWKNENIYTMVQLNSFTDPSTIPYKYHIELLTTQYRSIPEIGEVFSRFAYGGVLQHFRASNSRRPLFIEDFLDVKSLNIIKFPVSKYESIYRPKRLQSKSNYQIYSALFAFEFVKFLSSHIKLPSGDDIFRIGLIAPYKAQSDLIDKLMSSITSPKNIDVQVGTIHGFQGDECNIIIALFNPPPAISTSKEMFLNKLNIINVSISRSRDYLFVIMPDDNTENVENLTLIKRVETLCKEQSCCTDWHSSYLEKVIFGKANYLEDNSFSTSHQLVNVYRKPEKYYEVRSEDNAVDVQIHE